jgi:hypothetical protein
MPPSWQKLIWQIGSHIEAFRITSWPLCGLTFDA